LYTSRFDQKLALRTPDALNLISNVMPARPSSQFFFRITPDNKILEATTTLTKYDWRPTKETNFLAPNFLGGAITGLIFLPDESIFVYGTFTTVGGIPLKYAARLTPSGDLEPDFALSSGFNGPIHTASLLPNGDVLVGGAFTEFDGKPEYRIHRFTFRYELPSARIGFSHGLIEADEATRSVQVTLRRDGSIDNAVTVQFSTSEGGSAAPGIDYSPTNVSVSFDAGESEKVLTLLLSAENETPGDERTIYLSLTAATPGLVWTNRSMSKIVILDNDVGLRANYFSGAEFEELKTIVTNTTVNFDWGLGAPFKGAGANFSVIWTGTMIPSTTEDYTFYFASKDSRGIWINGLQILADSPTLNSIGRIHLHAGQKYNFIVQMQDDHLDGAAILEWSTATIKRQVVPPTVFRPSTMTSIPPILTPKKNGWRRGLSLLGTPGGIYEIQSSPDLSNWKYFRRVSPISGSVEMDANTSHGPVIFYRAVVPD